MVGIYKITNLVNGKAYVGQSIDIKRRWAQHKSDAFNINCDGYYYPLYQAFRKYGLSNFVFEILEECLVSDLDNKEIYYIAKYDTYHSGYNQDEGGSSVSHYNKLSDELVAQIILRLKTSKDSSDAIGAEFGVSGRTIRAINAGQSCRIDDVKYPIRGSLILCRTDNFCTICGTKIGSKSKRYCVKCSQLAQRKAERPLPLELAKMVRDLGGFRNVGKYYGVSDKAIVNWCVQFGIPSKRKELEEWYDKQVGKPAQTTKEKIIQNKPVQQIDPVTNKVIAIFESANEAARKLGKKKGSHISEACNGIHQTAHGYKWQYVA